MKKPFLGALFVMCMLSSPLCVAGSAGAVKSTQPIKIKSNELLTDTNNRTATFVGQVSARQGDMTIYSDKLIIRYSEKDRDVETVEATGNVKIIQGDSQAFAGHALYENKAGKIVLDLSPKVYQGSNVVSGKVITYFVEDQKSVVTGRVEAEVHPGEKGRNGGAKP